MSLLAFLMQGALFPQANASQWGLLMLSGILGFSLGDGFLFTAFLKLGAKRTLLIFSANPVISAVLGWILLGERLQVLHIAGILLAVFGIMFVIRSDVPRQREKAGGFGILAAVLATLGQAGGVLLSKAGMLSLDAVPAAQIRLIGGVLGMAVLLFFLRQWKSVPAVLKEQKGRLVITTNVMLGTLVGMVLSMVAIKLTQVAVASILTSLMPVMILPISAFLLKEKVSLAEVIGAIITVLGVSLLFL